MTSATRHDPLVRPRHVVTAVLVAHDGARWLPTTLHAVKTQRRPVQRFVAVDTGSRDETPAMLERAVGASSVLSAPRGCGFAAAAHLAVAAFATAPGLASTRSDAGAPVEWIWLLHDDSAPTANALELLLELADEMPSAAVIGPKLVGWDDDRRLLEVGVTVDRGGRRETGLEPGELDHGQHDGDRDVLAVSTAGMLVRRDVWEQLGGLDRALPLFRDDLDFGWRANLAGHRVVICTRAVVHHAEAAASGVRHIDAATPYRRRLDRQAALRTMVVNASAPWLPWIVLRLLLASLVRGVVFVLVKRPFDGWDEVRAAVAVFAHPFALFAARAARKPNRTVPGRQVRALLAPRGTRLRHYADSAAGRLATVATSGGAGDGAADSRGLVRRIVTRPGVLLFGALLVVALVAQRHVLGGAVYGGALLPAPAGASDLWQTYTQSWHPTGFGSSAVAPPYLGILAIVAAVLFGSAHLAVQVLLLGSVPLAGLSAYVAVKPLAPATRVRLWVAAAYALLPVVTGAVSSGRLGAAVVAMVLPVALSALARALLPPLTIKTKNTRALGRRSGFRWQGARPAWLAVLPLTIATAFDPIVYVLLAPLVLAALVAGVVRRSWLAIWRALVVLVATPLLLLPWTSRVVHYPSLLVAGLGRTSPGLQDSRLSPLDVLLLHPGGPGMPPAWLDVVVVIAGLAGLVQLTRPGPARLGWLIALAGFAGGLVVSHLHVRVPGADAVVPGWPGTATTVMGAGVLMSAAVAGARLRARLATTSFGWRQPVALTMSLAAVATPITAAGMWLARGTGPVLTSGATQVLPAFITDPATSRDGPRTIVLRPAESGAGAAVTYSFLRDRSPQLGDADLPPDPGHVARADAAVADLVGGLGQVASTELAHLGVRYVLVPQAGDGGLGARIAAAGGLLPKATDSGWQVWQVESDAGRVAIATAGAQDWQLPVLPANDTSGTGGVGRHATPLSIPADASPRWLVLAEAPASAWRASVAGPGSAGSGSSGSGSGGSGGAAATPLVATTQDGMQAFELPAAGGDVVVFRAPDRRANWLVFELVGWLVVVGAAIPAGRRAADQQRIARHGADAEPVAAPGAAAPAGASR